MPETPTIVRTPGYQVGDKFFPELIEAQKESIRCVIGLEINFPSLNDKVSLTDIQLEAVTLKIIANSDWIVEVLTTTATSRNKARRINGGSKKRKVVAQAPTV